MDFSMEGFQTSITLKTLKLSIHSALRSPAAGPALINIHERPINKYFVARIGRGKISE